MVISIFFSTFAVNRIKMSKELRTYLEWSFRVNNIPKYQRYRDEWINNIPSQNLWYYEIEMQHLREVGIYKN